MWMAAWERVGTAISSNRQDKPTNRVATGPAAGRNSKDQVFQALLHELLHVRDDHLGSAVGVPSQAGSGSSYL